MEAHIHAFRGPQKLLRRGGRAIVEITRQNNPPDTPDVLLATACGWGNQEIALTEKTDAIGKSDLIAYCNQRFPNCEIIDST